MDAPAPPAEPPPLGVSAPPSAPRSYPASARSGRTAAAAPPPLEGRATRWPAARAIGRVAVARAGGDDAVDADATLASPREQLRTHGDLGACRWPCSRFPPRYVQSTGCETPADTATEYWVSPPVPMAARQRYGRVVAHARRRPRRRRRRHRHSRRRRRRRPPPRPRPRRRRRWRPGATVVAVGRVAPPLRKLPARLKPVHATPASLQEVAPSRWSAARSDDPRRHRRRHRRRRPPARRLSLWCRRRRPAPFPAAARVFSLFDVEHAEHPF